MPSVSEGQVCGGGRVHCAPRGWFPFIPHITRIQITFWLVILFHETKPVENVGIGVELFVLVGPIRVR
jgi:hypothetical protein